jgi:uncharacterized Zn finger protein
MQNHVDPGPAAAGPPMGALPEGRRFEVGCTIFVSHTFESLHAHVELDGNIPIYPGDEVIVQGAPVRVPYGETAEIRRMATVVRASPLERLWTRATGRLEVMELLEFSFSERTRL